jgi:pyruvate dehydrogenase E2 component (dihydrolipoamide acetyltransferase)
MAQVFTMPQLGSTMEEGTILKWHKREGDAVKAGEILLEIETDKSTMEVEAPSDGVVRKILAAENALVPIREPIAILGSADEPIDALIGGGESQTNHGGHGDTRREESPLPTAEHRTPNADYQPPATSHQPPVAISPRARRLAEERGVAVSALAGRGTGIEGRIVERDVLAYLEAQPVAAVPAVESGTERAMPRLTPLAVRMADNLGVNVADLATGLPGSRVRSEDVLRHAEAKSETTAPTAQGGQNYTTAPFAGMRKRIADNVVKSAFSAPHVTLTLEVDMTACTELRAQAIPAVEKAYGSRLSFTDILVKAVAFALADFPRLNASLVGEEVRIYTQKNIGVAVALDEGLIVPVVKEAERKSLGAISVELKQLVERARTGKFTPDDLAGGTFTITNLGAFRIDVFDPIIVTGQAAILGVGRIADKPVVVNKAVVVRAMMNLCLSFDHRIVDGAPAARFLQRVKELLEAPMQILV